MKPEDQINTARRSDDKTSQKFGVVVSVAALVAIQSVIQALNATTLLFTGALQAAFGSALLTALLSTVVLLIIGSMGGSFRGVILAPHSAYAIGMLVPVATIVSAAPDEAPIEIIAFGVFILLSIGALLTGLVCLALARSGGSRMSRHLPTPLVAGLMASVALQILIGGVKNATASHPDW